VISTPNRSTVRYQGADQIGWAAGLFEGEGSIYIDRADERRNGGRLGIALSLASTDEDVIRHFHDCIGSGRVFGPYTSAKSTKPYWMWKLRNAEKVAEVAATLYPLLSRRRREQIDLALGEWRKADASYRPRPLGPRPGPLHIDGQIGMSC
jgi:hypothetical protein